MKKVLFILLVLFFFMGNVNAQEGKMHIGAAVEIGLPIGDWSDFAGTGIGGSARFEYAFSKQIVGMLTAGYISFGGKETESFSYSYSAIPILPGVKYYFKNGLYGMAELGLHFFSVDVEVPAQTFNGFTFGGSSGSSSSTEFTISLGAGFETPISDNLILDANVKFAIISDANYFGVRVGLKIALDKL